MTLRIKSLSLGLAAAALLVLAGASQAQDNSCQSAFQQLSAKRMGQIQRLQALIKAGKGKMNPVSACPVARALGGADTDMLNYMVKNKDWCQIPDNVIEQFKVGRNRDVTLASQACAAAAKFKQMEAQARSAQTQAQMQAPRLPAGPL